MAELPLHDLFVSYVDADAGWVEGYLLDALIGAEVTVHSQVGFEPGRPDLLGFGDAVRSSRRILLVISTAYLADVAAGFVDIQAQDAAMKRGEWAVIPLLREAVELPPRLAMLRAIDATDPAKWDDAIARLCEVAQSPLPPQAPAPPCPYPGMRPFTEAESTDFHGRRPETAELERRLHAQKDRKHRFLAVIGPSGSGKSSLVFAGLVPALRGSTLFGSGSWTVRALRPGPTPMDAPRLSGDDPALDGPTLPELLAAPPAGRLLLIVDQFEELFTVADPRQVVPFQEEVARLAVLADVFVVVTVRADFYDRLMPPNPLWPLIDRNRVEVLPLDKDGLREAIVLPARREGVYIDSALVERLVADAAGEPGSLPLMQETLVLLWAELERRYLPLHAYERLVEPGDRARTPGLTGLQVAVARHADAVLNDLTVPQQEIARRIFLGLVQVNQEHGQTRRSRSLAALHSVDDDPARFNEVVEHLTRNRLLTVSGAEAASERQVDLAHEALIAGWPWLRGLVTAHRAAVQTKDRMDARVADWERHGHEAGLLDAVELAEADDWLSNPDARMVGYGEGLPALVAASRAAHDREAQRLRRRMYGAVAFAALALLAAVFAFTQYQEAATQRDQAEIARREAVENESLALTNEELAEDRAADAATAQAAAEAAASTAEAERIRAHTGQLTAESGNLSDDQLDLSLLLALESNRIADTPETRAAIAAALNTSPRFTGYVQGDPGSGYSLAFSPDGRLLAISRPGGVELRDAVSGEHLGEPLVGHDGQVNTVAFSPNGDLLATGGEDGQVRLWDVDDREQQGEPLDGHSGAVNSIAFSPDGQTLISGGYDHLVNVWDVESGDMVAEPFEIDTDVTSLAFSPGGEMFAVSGHYNAVSLWDSTTHRQVRTLTFDGSLATYSTTLAFSPTTPNLLASGDSDGEIRFWDVSTGESVGVALSGHRSVVVTLAFSEDGESLASGGYDGTVRLWNLDTRQAIGEPLRGHGRIIADVTFQPSADAATLVSSSDDGRLVFWTVEPAYRFSTQIAQQGSELPAPDLVMTSDGKMVISPLPFITFWDTSAPLPPTRSLSLLNPAQSLALNPQDPAMLAAGGANGTIVLWDTDSGEPLGEPFPAHDGAVRTVAFNADGAILASGGVDGTVRLWNVREMTPMRQPITGYADIIDTVAFSPTDPNLLAFGGTDGVLILWDIESGEPVGGALEGHVGRVQSVAFHPDGQLLASGSSDGTVRLWPVSETGVRETLRIENASAVLAVVFSPDGHLIAAGDVSGNLHLWDAHAREPVAPPLAGHTSGILSLVFSPDSKFLASGGLAGEIVIWDMDFRSWQERACELAGRNLSSEEWSRYFGDEPYHVTCDGFPPGVATASASPEVAPSPPRVATPAAAAAAGVGVVTISASR